MTFKRLILLILGWLGFIYAVPVVILHLAVPEEVRASRLDAFYARADRIEAITLGSSHGRSIYYPATGLVGHALSEDNGDISTAEMKLRAALTRLPALDYVFMPVSPAILTHDHRIEATGTALLYRTWLRNTPLPVGRGALAPGEALRLYAGRVLSDATFLEVNALAKDALTGLIRGALGGVDDALGGPCKVIENPATFPHEDGILNGFYRTPLPARCLAEASAANARNHVARARQSVAEMPDIRARNLALLRRMAETAARADVTLIFVVTPFTEAYYETPALRGMWEPQRAKIAALAAETGARFYDFHDFFWDTGYAADNRIFTDGNHLTRDGAAAFSAALAARVARDDPELAGTPAADPSTR